MARPSGQSWSLVFFILLCFLVYWLAQLGHPDAQRDGEGLGSWRQDFGDVIGIDLGTTYSRVGVMLNGKVEILANEQGNRITPNYVAFNDQERLVGEAAQNQCVANPTRTIFDCKRLIGRKFSDKDVQSDINHFPFRGSNRNDKPAITVEVQGKDRSFSPEEVSSMVLGKMKVIAENYLGKKVVNAVVTVPSYFNDKQRQATKDAGTIAGLNVLRIMNEPTAAAIAYGLKHAGGERKIIIYDLGGGTFDVSLLTIHSGIFIVEATAGDTHLGGEDFDQRITSYSTKKYNKDKGVDITKDLKTMGKLKREVEKAKRTLSSQISTRLEIENFFKGEDFAETLTRDKFEELNIDLFEKTLEPVEQVLKDAKLKKNEINDVVLVGGSTRIPKVQNMLEEFFGKPLSKGINPDEAVAFGAAVLGGYFSGAVSIQDVLLVDIIPLTLGIETTGGDMNILFPRGTSIPRWGSRVFSTSADNQSVILIPIFEGEGSMTKDNNLLGTFEVTGIPPSPRGQIEVSFDLDPNGILKVSIYGYKGIDKTENITITNDKGRLSQEEIDRMIVEAQEFAEEDKANAEPTQALSGLVNELFSLINQASGKEDRGGKTDVTRRRRNIGWNRMPNYVSIHRAASEKGRQDLHQRQF